MAVARRFENNGYSAAAASGTHESRFEARQREVGTARANESIDVELLSVNAFPDPLHAVARAVGAPHVYLPAEASRDALHGNRKRTSERFVKPALKPVRLGVKMVKYPESRL